MKKLYRYITATAIAVMMIPSLTVNAASAKNFKINIDNKPITINKEIGYPFINEDSRTLVPVRVISENLGYKVDWDAENRIVLINVDDKEVALKIGKNFAIVDGVEKPLSVKPNSIVWDKTAAQIKDDRTYVPLRFISEEFGCVVDYKQDSNNHYINIYKNTEMPKDTLAEEKMHLSQENYYTASTNWQDMAGGYFDVNLRPDEVEKWDGKDFSYRLVSPAYLNDIDVYNPYDGTWTKSRYDTIESTVSGQRLFQFSRHASNMVRDHKTKKPVKIPPKGTPIVYEIKYKVGNQPVTETFTAIMP